jgi:uncharacterized protein (DUF488 family)
MELLERLEREQSEPPMSCPSTKTIHTIGHSTRAIEVFLELLQAHEIQLLIDVRRWPASKRHPHFNREALAAALTANDVEYFWRGDLGGFRKPAPDSPNSAWQVGAFRAYADFMLTPGFDAIMAELEPIAEQQRIALMCAEAVPWQCHRQLLADAFLVRGWNVLHIMEKGCRPHALPPFAKVDGQQIVYSGLI